MTNSFDTPILFVVFNRPNLTMQVFNQIKKVKPKYLYLAADGPRANRPDDLIKCAETRKIKDLVDWDCELKILFREENLGCGIGVSSAISWFFEYVDAGIILEDDCFPDLSFFPFCEELLNKYKEDPRINSIGGNNFQNGIKRGNSSYYYSHYPATWGWATWKRSWNQFTFDINDAATNIKNSNLDVVFSTKQEKRFWLKEFIKANASGSHIWDYHYLYSIWKNNGICLIPNVNLVINLGFFEDGTHFFLKDSRKTNIRCEHMELPLVHPEDFKVNKEADNYLFQNLFNRSFSKLFRILRENDTKSIIYYIKSKINKQ